MPETAFILAAHGTADPRGLREATNLAAGIRALRPHLPIRLAYLEKADPDLATALDWGAARAPTVVLVPLFLNSGTHLDEDLPQILMAAGRRHPANHFAMTTALGGNGALPHLLSRRVAEVRGRLPQGPLAAVLAAHGARSRDIQDELTRLAAATAAQCALPVHPAFTALGAPDLEDVLGELATSGFRGAVILSHRLLDGRIQDALIERVAAIGRTLPTLATTVARPYGPDPDLCAALTGHLDSNTAFFEGN